MSASIESESPSIDDILATLTTALKATTSSLPEATSIEPPKSGISLLDVKSDLLLSYLHNLSFLSILRLRGVPLNDAATPAINELIKFRVLLERGVKSLESKLKYQIDKVVAAAQEAEDARNPKPAAADEEEDNSGSESENDDDDDDNLSVSGDEGHNIHSASAPPPLTTASAAELSFRPNPASLALAAAREQKKSARGRRTDDDNNDAKDGGVYRPPRIAPTAMPELPTTTSGRRERDAPIRNRAMDDFVADELSVAPVSQPSIGSTIVGQGRTVKTAQERREEAERRDYEESNFVRLPKLSKKEMLQQRKRTRGARDNQFGGEDWRGFAGDLDRLTKSSGRGGKGERVLDRSRKRRGDGDGDNGGGRKIGGHFEGRKNMLNKRRKM